MKETGSEKGNLDVCLDAQSSSTLCQKIRVVTTPLSKKICIKRRRGRKSQELYVLSMLGMGLFCQSP